MKRLFVILIVVLSTASFAHAQEPRLFGMKGDIYVRAGSSPDRDWTLKCISQGAEGRVIVTGKEVKTIPLKNLIIGDIDYSEYHCIIFRLTVDDWDEYTIPFLEVMIYQGNHTYRLANFPALGKPPGNSIELYYYYHPERWTP